ncbi:HNH endonuclease [Vibrio tubiashii]|uniref:HNH endonuclease n=1 Tax=Vibrio tubiashii TaxID=29498 RepID=A0AAE5GU21_9VIBR|nr:HNH endonuclease signature motif containing protein [Vibrio tubiashii]NOI83065.1 HNH endonuclease [Vibrio tubiashii]
MARISDKDIKILWGRASGICSNPTCRKELTRILEFEKSTSIGEMAHIIARSEGGPRGVEGGGSNSYENLVLLCPTCHTEADKAPEEFPIEMLHSWKKQTESLVRGLIENISKNDLYRVFETANNAITFQKHISYSSEKSRVVEKEYDVHLYKMLNRVDYHARYLKLSDENLESITSLITSIQEKLSNKRIKYYSELDRDSRNLVDKIRYSLFEERDRLIFQLSLVYSNLVSNVAIDRYNTVDKDNFYKVYLEVFDEVDNSVRNIIDGLSNYTRSGKQSDFEGELFSQLKFQLEHLSIR